MEERKIEKAKQKRRSKMYMKKNMLLFTCLIFTFFAMGTIVAKEGKEEPAVVEEHLYEDQSKLKYPQVKKLSSKKAEEKINNDFTTYIQNSAEEWEEIRKDAEENNYKSDYQTDFDVKYNQPPYLSILTSNYMYTGGAHGNTVVESFNYDTTEGTRIYLTDILTSEDQLKDVQNYVWEYAIERPEIFYPDLKKEDVILTKDTAFYFNDTGITLVFQQYEIAPYVSGNQEIVIPEELYD